MAREIHIDPTQWDSMSESSAHWHDYNDSGQERSEWEAALQQAAQVLWTVISLDLTDRQREVVRFRFSHDALTQARIGTLLRISQPTVSQHLHGKKRNGKKIGGAVRRIQKGIRRRASARSVTDESQKVLRVLDDLLSQRQSRREGTRLLHSLGRHRVLS